MFNVSKVDAEREYMFYEVYADDAAVAHHKSTPHYAAWADFRARGGVENQENTVCKGIYI